MRRWRLSRCGFGVGGDHGCWWTTYSIKLTGTVMHSWPGAGVGSMFGFLYILSAR
jgi:hypothetical protein